MIELRISTLLFAAVSLSFLTTLIVFYSHEEQLRKIDKFSVFIGFVMAVFYTRFPWYMGMLVLLKSLYNMI